MPEANNGESRLDRIERLLDETSTEHRERMRDFDARQEVLRVNIESLHTSVGELHELVQANSRAIAEHTEQLRIDAEHIRALVRIAEIHERRLSDLEGDQQA
ncbi:MAG TPA: hypothetical protein VMJ34_09610 [Bryobacteraceae bacterium]|nr:hypothetical protein [Bryobacteraceae bacterium]